MEDLEQLKKNRPDTELWHKDGRDVMGCEVLPRLGPVQLVKLSGMPLASYDRLSTKVFSLYCLNHPSTFIMISAASPTICFLHFGHSNLRQVIQRAIRARFHPYVFFTY